MNNYPFPHVEGAAGMSSIQTYSGVMFDLSAPSPADVRPVDISFALSNLARFNGHTREFFSVAQHSLIVADLVEPEHELFALLHDAAEAYTGDIVSPLKALLGKSFRAIERDVQDAIDRHFGLSWNGRIAGDVKRADAIALATERRDLFLASTAWDQELPPPADAHIVPWTPARARAAFEARLAPLIAHTFNHPARR